MKAISISSSYCVCERRNENLKQSWPPVVSKEKYQNTHRVKRKKYIHETFFVNYKSILFDLLCVCVCVVCQKRLGWQGTLVHNDPLNHRYVNQPLPTMLSQKGNPHFRSVFLPVSLEQWVHFQRPVVQFGVGKSIHSMKQVDKGTLY